MQINDVRNALAVAVKTAATDDIPLTTFGYVPEDGPTPFAYVQLESITYDRTFNGGSVEAILTIMVMVSRADDLTCQQHIDALVSDAGDNSIYAAIMAANGEPGELALDGAADYVHCVGLESPPRWYEWREGVKYHGVGLKVRVIGTQG